MTVGKWLAQAQSRLEKTHIGSAQLDALILLEDETGKDRGWLLAHPEYEISKTKQKKLESKLKKREKHLPLAYIRGFSEFYGRKFLVNRHVIEPRPEAEPMIDFLKKLSLPARPVIADVGTGSGCIGIAAALELPNAHVDLYDIDAGALAVAKHNLALHELHLKAYKRDLLSHHVRHYDVILANLPYIPDRYKLNRPAEMEPKIAFFGGKDGLDVYRRLFRQLQHFQWQPQYVLTEALPPQHEDLAEIAQHAGFKQIKSDDFIQVFANS